MRLLQLKRQSDKIVFSFCSSFDCENLELIRHIQTAPLDHGTLWRGSQILNRNCLGDRFTDEPARDSGGMDPRAGGKLYEVMPSPPLLIGDRADIPRS